MSAVRLCLFLFVFINYHDILSVVEKQNITIVHLTSVVYVGTIWFIGIPVSFIITRNLQAEFEKAATIMSAEGDAEAAKMLSKAFDKVGDSLIELRKMEAAEEIAANLAGSRNVVYLPKDKSMLLNLPA